MKQIKSIKDLKVGDVLIGSEMNWNWFYKISKITDKTITIFEIGFNMSNKQTNDYLFRTVEPAIESKGEKDFFTKEVKHKKCLIVPYKNHILFKGFHSEYIGNLYEKGDTFNQYWG